MIQVSNRERPIERFRCSAVERCGRRSASHNRGWRLTGMRSLPAGSAVVELAVCLPAIVLLVLGAIEACTAIFVKQSLHIAAYEAARSAIAHEATAAVAEANAEAILDQRRIQGSVIEWTPDDIEAVERGEDITVRITAPARPNLLTNLGIFRGDMVAEATMVKE